ncbi:MAG: DUF4189 domain-containing protein [Acidobacteriota bacterium]
MKKILLAVFLALWWVSVVLASGGLHSSRRNNWGAIAYSKSSGRIGYSYDYATEAQAINSAVERCGVRDCQAVVWFVNGCGALAKGDKGYGWAIGASRSEAEGKALAECRKRGGGCRIVQWACTSR